MAAALCFLDSLVARPSSPQLSERKVHCICACSYRLLQILKNCKCNVWHLAEVTDCCRFKKNVNATFGI